MKKWEMLAMAVIMTVAMLLYNTLKENCFQN